jgi:hypothetical protein
MIGAFVRSVAETIGAVFIALVVGIGAALSLAFVLPIAKGQEAIKRKSYFEALVFFTLGSWPAWLILLALLSASKG